MYSKTEVIERPYSDAELERLEKLFAELIVLSKTKEAKEHVRRVRARLRA